MIVEYHPEARAELIRGRDYYERCEEGLGYDFSVEVLSAVQKIVDYPEAWPAVEGDVRRYLMNRFPYGILYSIEADRIFIVAVMDLHREPDYWKDRAPNQGPENRAEE